MNMKFNENGKFKIMQITDIQEIPSVSPDTVKLLNAAISQEKPDLVVLTGDQIKGYGTSYKIKGKNVFDAVRDTLELLIKPIVEANIPYAVTFGNHDRQVGISNTEQFEKIYKKGLRHVGWLQAEVGLAYCRVSLLHASVVQS